MLVTFFQEKFRNIASNRLTKEKKRSQFYTKRIQLTHMKAERGIRFQSIRPMINGGKFEKGIKSK